MLTPTGRSTTARLLPYTGTMTIKSMDHVSVIVDDLAGRIGQKLGQG